MTMWDSFYFAFISFTTIGFGNHGFYNGDNANLSKVQSGRDEGIEKQSVRDIERETETE